MAEEAGITTAAPPAATSDDGSAQAILDANPSLAQSIEKTLGPSGDRAPARQADGRYAADPGKRLATPAARRQSPVDRQADLAELARTNPDAEELRGTEFEKAGEADEAGATGEAGPEGEGKGEGAEAEGKTPDEAGKVEPQEAPATLPHALIQAAKRSGWTDAEVEEFAKADPDLAERTFQKLKDSSDQLSERYAAMGQGRAAPAPQAPQPPTGPGGNGHVPDPTASLVDTIFDPKLQVDIPQADGSVRKGSVWEKYGPDFRKEIIDPLIGPLNELYGFVQQQRAQGMAQQIEGWHKALPKEEASLYGQSDSVTPEQVQARTRLWTYADQIRAGAAAQGLDMSIDEALGRAHSVVSRDHLASLERKRLTAQIQTRSKQLTARPTQRHGGAGTGTRGGERSDDAAMRAVARRAEELGLRFDQQGPEET
jgi:hypothetical protein